MAKKTGAPDGAHAERLGPWMWTAYRAYHELLREKLRARFEKQEGPWMDRVADILAELVSARWESDRRDSPAVRRLRARLDALLSE